LRCPASPVIHHADPTRSFFNSLTPLLPVNAPCIFSGFSGSGHDLSSHAIALQQLSSIRTFSHFVCDITVT
ncbi:hypothetical protein, partial [Sphingomonas sp. FUKUSWIS1]|uniref:hypothetical protein n=1 Tax=Sphingomonas sp. FUKUSWIS1 TaxID=1379701 RepID=UPI001F1F5ED2